MTAKYSYYWASGVVHKLWDKHPRATEMTCEMLRISERDLTAFLAHGDEIFPVIRDIIHQVEVLMVIHGSKSTMELFLQKLTGLYTRKGPKRIADRLTSVANSLNIKEQSKEGRMDRLLADPSQPFLPGFSEVTYGSERQVVYRDEEDLKEPCTPSSEGDGSNTGD